jgi:hypothetical protein
MVGYIYDLRLAYGSTTTITVGPPNGAAGNCSDSTGATDLSISSQQTITISTAGAINGNDSFTGPGTVTASSSSATVTGTSTTFFTSFGTRSIGGTVSSSGTTVTGTSTTFLSSVAVADLIGNSTNGYYVVTAIASDTSLTLGITPGTAFSGASVSVIENPSIEYGSNSTEVTSITSNTVLTVVNSVTVTGSAYSIGTPAYFTNYPYAYNTFMYVWVGNGTSGTGVYVSTQRTTPFGISGYATYIRRIGTILLTNASVVPFDQTGLSNERYVQYEVDWNTNYLLVLNGGASTSWSGICFAALAPPTASMVYATSYLQTDATVSYRKRAAGQTVVHRPMFIQGINASTAVCTYLACPCDGAQYIEYGFNASGGLAYVYAFGYGESV